MYAVNKKYGYLLGLVLEAPDRNTDRVKVDRSWLYGKVDKKLQDNVFYLTDVELKELDPATLLIEENKVRDLWDNNYSRVMREREIWQKTWIIK